jgi:hypothetical protein
VIDTRRIGHIIRPPALKLRTKKFVSRPSGAGVAAGVALAAGTTLAVATAGDIAAAAGVMPGAGETAAMAGLIAVAGAVGGAPAGLVGGGGDAWPKKVDTSVTEQRQAISSVFIGLIGKFFAGSNFDRDFRFLYPQ